MDIDVAPATASRRGRVWWLVAAVVLAAAVVTVAVVLDEDPPATARIETIAGTDSGFGGDDGPAVEASLALPSKAAVDSDGRILITDTHNSRIRAIAPDGTITTIAGTGTSGYGGDDGPAIEAELTVPVGIAAHPDGRILFTDMGNDRVRAIDPDGTITTIAGTGDKGFFGDDGPATHAGVDFPRGVAVDSDGRILIADTGNHRVRAIATDGTITTVAGTGQEGFAGDDGPALDAQLALPSGVAVHPDGTILIADTGNRRVRAIALDGTISTIAGPGQPGEVGDGGNAIDAQLIWPNDVAVDAENRVLVIDTGDHRVRAIDARGRISTVAGTGVDGFAGDDDLATDAQLDRPEGVTVHPDGRILIVDKYNDRIRAVR